MKGNFDIARRTFRLRQSCHHTRTKSNRSSDNFDKSCQNYDYVFVDLGRGLIVPCARWLATAATLLSSRTNRLPFTDAYAYIKLSRAANPQADMRVVVNMASTTQEGEDFATSAKHQSFYNTSLLWPVLFDVIQRYETPFAHKHLC